MVQVNPSSREAALSAFLASNPMVPIDVRLEPLGVDEHFASVVIRAAPHLNPFPPPPPAFVPPPPPPLMDDYDAAMSLAPMPPPPPPLSTALDQPSSLSPSPPAPPPLAPPPPPPPLLEEEVKVEPVPEPVPVKEEVKLEPAPAAREEEPVKMEAEGPFDNKQLQQDFDARDGSGDDAMIEEAGEP